MSEDLKVYLVTLKRVEDLEDFYQDMETEGGNLYIPDRLVECTDRGPDSRVTRYMLTAEEADCVSKDPRVEAVELNYEDAKIRIVPFAGNPIQDSSTWDKSNTVSNTMLNWGLVRMANGKPALTTTRYPDGIGYDTDIEYYSPGTGTRGTTWDGFTYLSYNTLKLMTLTNKVANTWVASSGYWDIPGGSPGTGESWGDYADTNYYRRSINARIQLNSSGKNVDVVIIDGGHIDPDHPEFARNPDGTGGTRWVNYNWFQHNEELGKGPNSQYDYSYWGVDSHHMHCTGTVAGITQGWAKEANIYSLTYNVEDAIRYVRAFHKNKPINPATGRRNPTIVNNSWGTILSYSWNKSRISKITRNGTVYNRPVGGMFSDQQLHDLEMITTTSGFYVRSPSLEADFISAMEDGVVCVCAAGNSRYNTYDDENNNTFTVDGIAGTELPNGTYDFLKGASPGAHPRHDLRINVGALDIFPWDSKAMFSSTGTKVDFYAPGYNIMSSYTNSKNINNAVPSVINSSFYLQKLQGTSMASPQVTGLIACLAEHYPHWTNKEFREYLAGTAEKGAITSGAYRSISPFKFYRFDHSAGSGPTANTNNPRYNNRIPRFIQQRPSVGAVWPPQNRGLRNQYVTDNTGSTTHVRSMYPRPKSVRK